MAIRFQDSIAVAVRCFLLVDAYFLKYGTFRLKLETLAAYEIMECAVAALFVFAACITSVCP